MRRTFRSPLLALVLLAPVANNALAQGACSVNCIDACYGSHNCGFASGNSLLDCQRERQDCITFCQRGCQQSDGVPARGHYGALAYGKTTGAWGLSTPSVSQLTAEKSALAACRQYTSEKSDCVIGRSVFSICVAVAVTPDSRRSFVASAENNNKQEAWDRAVSRCGDCVVTENSSRCY